MLKSYNNLILICANNYFFTNQLIFVKKSNKK